MEIRFLYTIFAFCLCLFLPKNSFGQEKVQEFVPFPHDSISNIVDTLQNDTSKVLADSISTDTLSLKKEKNKNAFEFPVDFSAADSIVMYGNGRVHLYKDGIVVYKESQQKEIKADFISVQMDSSTMHASGVLDTIGELIGKPVFKDGGQEYEAKEINYNFKTQKGYIRGAKTQEGDGYIIADQTKKTADGYMNMKGGKYTTCDNHDHPHFYLQLTKGKVKPGGYVAAGPAYMVLEDVPLPLAIPFGFFPFTSKYASGIIMPSYGDEFNNGFFLRNGGYYFAINDYLDLALTGDIYTKGTWRLNLQSNYIKRYKFRGNVNITYNNFVSGEKDMPNYSVKKDFSVRWQHSQDAKASQFSTFSAYVDFKTSGYNKNEIRNVYNAAEQSQNEAASSINYSQRFPESPFSFSLNAGISQRMRDSTISLTLPNFTLNMSQIYPFKRKNRIGKERFYERFTFSFNATFENSLPSTKEDRVLKTSFTKDWRNGIQYRPSISLPLTVFKYVNITPSVSYSGRINFKKVEQDWNMAEQRVVYDTISGFYHVYNFSAGVSASTKLYGFYSPIKKIKDALGIGDIRHMFTPVLSFNYSPDFGDPMWKMYKTYEQVIVDKTAQNMITRKQVKYSHLEGAPGIGEQQSMSLVLGNNLEMKVKDKAASDTADIPVYKTISLIDNLNLSASYNFAADSLNLSNIALSVRIKLTKSFSLNLSTSFNPYMYSLNENGSPVRINEFRWKHGKAPFFEGTGTNFSYTFNNSTFKKKDKKKSEEQEAENEENLDNYNDDSFLTDEQKMKSDPFADKKKNDKNKQAEKDLEGYQKPDIQWSLSVDYSFYYGRTAEFDKQKMDYKRGFTRSNLMLNGYINPTPNWKFNFTASLELLKKVRLTQLTFNMSRDLHCWHLTASVTPIGLYKSFMVTIGANSSLLQDLKYDKHSDNSNLVKWF